MPDLLAHVLAPWICCKISQLRSGKPEGKDVALVMLGSFLPDVLSLSYFLGPLETHAWRFLMPFHTPFGSIVLAAMISLMFPKGARAFGLLILGVASHFALDALLLHAGGGMLLLFPFSWSWGFQLGFLQSDSWIPAIVTVVIAVSLFLASKLNLRSNS